MPLMTRVPQKGGVGTGLSNSDVRADVALLRALLDDRRGGGPHPALLELRQYGPRHAPLDPDERVHQAQALERVPGVADFALVDLLYRSCSTYRPRGRRRRG